MPMLQSHKKDRYLFPAQTRKSYIGFVNLHRQLTYAQSPKIVTLLFPQYGILRYLLSVPATGNKRRHIIPVKVKAVMTDSLNISLTNIRESLPQNAKRLENFFFSEVSL